MKYPIQRDLDGLYGRFLRDEKPVDLCFSDLTEEEQDKFLSNLDRAGLIRVCKHLAHMLHTVGDQLDLMGG